MKVTYLKLINNEPFYVGMGSEFRALTKSQHNKTRKIKEHVCSVVLSTHGDKVAATLQEQGMILWLNPTENFQSWNSGHVGQKHSTASWWTDGKTSVRSHTQPGKNWRRGRIVPPETEQTKLRKSKAHTGKRWWTNGIEHTQSKTCPGDGWKLGRLKNKKNR